MSKTMEKNLHKIVFFSNIYIIVIFSQISYINREIIDLYIYIAVVFKKTVSG